MIAIQQVSSLSVDVLKEDVHQFVHHSVQGEQGNTIAVRCLNRN